MSAISCSKRTFSSARLERPDGVFASTATKATLGSLGPPRPPHTSIPPSQLEKAQRILKHLSKVLQAMDSNSGNGDDAAPESASGRRLLCAAAGQGCLESCGRALISASSLTLTGDKNDKNGLAEPDMKRAKLHQVCAPARNGASPPLRSSVPFLSSSPPPVFSTPLTTTSVQGAGSSFGSLLERLQTRTQARPRRAKPGCASPLRQELLRVCAKELSQKHPPPQQLSQRCGGSMWWKRARGLDCGVCTRSERPTFIFTPTPRLQNRTSMWDRTRACSSSTTWAVSTCRYASPRKESFAALF